MALAVTSGLSRTCAVSGLVTHYINAHDHTNLRKEAPMLRVGATGTNKTTTKQNTVKNYSGKETKGQHKRTEGSGKYVDLRTRK
jgi:hypothetical protein